MGHTATLCHGVKPDPLMLDFSKIIKKRTTLYGVLTIYLQEDACVEGTPSTIEGINQYSDMLGQFYLTVLKSELSSHGGEEIESLISMKAISLIFSEMWAEASELLEGNKHLAKFDSAIIPLGEYRQRRFDLSRLETVIANRNSKYRIPSEHQFTYDFGNLLIKSYSKALVELQLCATGDNLFVIKHHASLLGDLLDEMLELVQYLHEGNPPSEVALPSNHPHHISSSE